MSITIQCTSCAKQYRVDGGVAGKKVRCKSCGAGFVAAPPAPPRAAPISPFDDDMFSAMAELETTGVVVDQSARPSAHSPAISSTSAANAAPPLSRRLLASILDLAGTISRHLPRAWWVWALAIVAGAMVIGFVSDYGALYAMIGIGGAGLLLLGVGILWGAVVGLTVGSRAIMASLVASPLLALFGFLKAGVRFYNDPKHSNAGDASLYGILIILAVGLVFITFIVGFFSNPSAFKRPLQIGGSGVLLMAICWIPMLYRAASTGVFSNNNTSAFSMPIESFQNSRDGVDELSEASQDLGHFSAASPDDAHILAAAGSPKYVQLNFAHTFMQLGGRVSSDPVPDAAPAKAQKTEQNLRRISEAIRQHLLPKVTTHYPESLDNLIKSGLLTRTDCYSPFSSSTQTSGLTATYVYFGGDAGMPRDQWVVFDKAELKAMDQTHILLASGEVRLVKIEDMQSLVDRSSVAYSAWHEEYLQKMRADRAARAANTDVVARTAPGSSRLSSPPIVRTPVSASTAAQSVKPVSTAERMKPSLARFDTEKSRLVASIGHIDYAAGKTTIIHPLSTSAFTGLIHSDLAAGQTVVELWDAKISAKKGEATFVTEAHDKPSFALNPAGTLLARVVRFPKLAVSVWSFKEGKELRTIPLSEKFGTPTLAGFLTVDRLAVHWSLRLDEGMEMFDVRTGQRLKQLPVSRSHASVNNGVTSPDGRFMALIPSQTKTGTPQLEFYDLLGPTGGFRACPIKELDASVASSPSGMAFSPDGKKLAALFARGTERVVLCWRVADGKLLGQYTVPITGRVANARAGRGLDWVNDGSAWLLMANTLVTAESNTVIGQLNTPSSAGEWLLDSTTIAVNLESASQVAAIKLNTAGLPRPTTVPTTAPTGR